MASTTDSSQAGLQITTRSDRSFPMKALQFCTKPFRPHLVKPRKEFPASSPELSPHSKAKSTCHVTPRKVCGIWIYDLVAKDAKDPKTDSTVDRGRMGKERERQRIYYFAGGGWQMPPSPEHWKLCAEMACQLPGSTVSIVSYPLAPNSPAKDSLPMLETLYPELFPSSRSSSSSPRVDDSSSSSSKEKIIFMGDSAGGNIVLGLTLHILSTSPSAPAPTKLIVISPAVDLRSQPQPTFQSILPQTDKSDPLLGIPFTNWTASNWSRGSDPSLPQISPLLADVAVLRERGVRVYGISAGNDVLGPPAKRFAEMCRDEGVQGRWLHWEGLIHCFPLAFVYGFREGREGVEWVLEAVKE